MVFNNPWGLLAFLSLPAIVALHFFHSRRRIRRIGGLHLWQFAEIRMPVGRKWQHLRRSLPLLLQLLAAALLSLLVAGADIPTRSTRRHFTILLDDSASMQARIDGRSIADAARRTIARIADAEDRLTIVTAGARPSVLAGPFATREEAAAALAEWTPQSPERDLEAGVNLASRFLARQEAALLLITDEPAPDLKQSAALTVHTIGQSIGNSAIEFADRARLPSGRDQVHAVLSHYGALPRETTLRATADGQTLFERKATIDPAKPLTLSFESARTDKTIVLEIDDDALALDNRARLAPLDVRTVCVAASGPGIPREHLARAVAAVPRARMVANSAEADLVFTTMDGFSPTARQVRACLMPPPEAPGEPRVALGRDIAPAPGNRLAEGLSLDGVIWAYAPAWETPAGRGVLYHRDRRLLTRVDLPEARAVYRLNLLPDRSSILGETAWPILVQGLVEECRAAMPGLPRSNFRVGERIALRLRAQDEEPIALLRDGAVYETYESLPDLIGDLPAGEYTVRQGSRDLARFAVNFYAPAESDLRVLASAPADLGALRAGLVMRSETNLTIYFAALFAIIILAATTWILQDTSR